MTESNNGTGMQFLILRLLQHNELGMFHSYRRLGKEGPRQRAINFDADVVARVFPSARPPTGVELDLLYDTDEGTQRKPHRLRKQSRNWRLEGNCPEDRCYDFVEPGCLFAMMVDSGQRPAIGGWAVYPADHPVTQAILAEGETGALTSHSMIALHGNEGSRSLSWLRRDRPSIFGSDESGKQHEDEEKMTATRASRNRPPNPRRLVDLLASVGHSLPSAVADIVDNSISKGATRIDITFRSPDEGHGRWMIIRDNGVGMDEEQLAEAMRIGSDVEYDERALGKYGYGLKGASWSQTRQFSVVSRAAGHPQWHLSWDVDRMENWDLQDDPIEDWLVPFTELDAHGTCVIWRNMRPPRAPVTARGVEPHTAEVQELGRHLALVFHRFLEGSAQGRAKLTLCINGIPVVPNNPVGHAGTLPHDRKPVRIELPDRESIVHVQAFVLPSEQEVRALHPNADDARHELDRLGMYGRRNESQGLYVYRNDRLIRWGGWHDMWATNDEKTKLARVVVDFGSELDELFDVNLSKREVKLSQLLQTQIKLLAKPARDSSQRKYRQPVPAGRPAVPAAPSGTSGNASAAAPATAGPSAQPGARSHATVTVPVRTVTTTRFAWKVDRDMMGRTSIEVNDREAELRALVDAIGGHAEGLDALAHFLRRLDRAGVQPAISAASSHEAIAK